MTASQTHTYIKTWIGRFCLFLFSLGCSLQPSQAAETLSLKLGPLQQSIKTEELENFAKTGIISPNLQAYRLVLTPEVQKMLQMRLYVEPHLAEKFLEDLFESTDGKRLLEQIQTALPETNPENIKQALNEAIKDPTHLNLLSFLRLYPSQNLQVDLQAIANIATQMSSSNLQGQLLGAQLANSLQVQDNWNFSTTMNPAVSGEERVYKETHIFRDKQRKRRVIVDIYYSLNSQGPLVVMSHGFAADRNFLKYLAYHLASYGLTVVSVEHPGSNIDSLVKTSQDFNLSQILPAQEFIERPRDITFVLNELENLNKKQGYLQGKFNTKQVTIIGHSFGGYTALAVAGGSLDPKEIRRFCQELTILGRSPADWLQCAATKLPYTQLHFRDSRISQVIAFNPIVGHLFGNSLQQIQIPSLIVASSADSITPNIAHQLKPFQQLGGEKHLIVAIGATHMSVTDMIYYLNSAMGQSTLVREVMDETAHPVRQMAMAVSLAFIQQLTPQATQYKPFLSPAYVQSLSSDYINLRLANKIPLSLDATITILALSHNKITLKNTKPKPSFTQKMQASINHIGRLFYKQEYHAGRLEQMFRGLLRNYYRHPGELS